MPFTHELWPKMNPALAHEILSTAQSSNKKLYRTALELFAPRMGLRSVKVLEMPKVERHAVWTQLLGNAGLEPLSFNLISTWLIETQTPLLCAWLDALNIAHDEKGCADQFPPEPSKADLQKAVDKLLAANDPFVVRLYLTSFNAIDSVQWPALNEIIESDPRLALK